MSWLSGLFSKIDGWFTSPKAKAAESTIESLIGPAMTIVQEINTIAPNKTLTELNAVATKYALPTITALQSGQTAGNVALNLGTAILQKNNAPTAAVSLLNTVIQLAVVASDTAAPVAPAPAA
jgi:hypothetical protein